MESDDPLDLLEQLLSLTERFRENMDQAENDTWARISATAADLRDGTDV